MSSIFDRVSVPAQVGQVGYGRLPVNYMFHELQDFVNQSRRQEEAIDKAIESGDQTELEKALTTGNNIVTAGNAVSAQPLRYQFLHNQLETISFAQNDARLMKEIPKVKVPSTTIEWTTFNGYGGPGDGFVAETGSDGAFGVAGSDDNFQRQFAQVKYMACQRTVGLVTQMVNNITNPMQAAETGANRELLAKQNLACYFADSTYSSNKFNGLIPQIWQWVKSNPSDSQIIYDAGGMPLDKSMLTDIALESRKKFGEPSMLLAGVTTIADTQKTLFPESRLNEGDMMARFGIRKNIFETEWGGDGGQIKLIGDVMLRPNRPLAADGPAVTGKPRISTTADAGALAFAVTPFATCAAAAAGTGNYFVNSNVNTDTAILGTAPNVPTAGMGGNAANRLSAGTYYYALSIVYNGLESVAWVYGAATAGTVTLATGVAPTAGQIVKVDCDVTTPCVTGLGSTYPLGVCYFRLYRAPSTMTSMSDFDYLMDIGLPSSGNARGYDNGCFIPGADNAIQITESKNGSKGWGLMSLMPLIKRPLPHLAMADLFALIWFGTPLFWAPRHHVHVRNIGRVQ